MLTTALTCGLAGPVWAVFGTVLWVFGGPRCRTCTAAVLIDVRALVGLVFGLRKDQKALQALTDIFGSFGELTGFRR